MEDVKSIGLTTVNATKLDNIMSRGWFNEAQEAGRFCLSYALVSGAKPGTTANVSTKWGASLFDSTGELTVLLSTLHPNHPPNRLMTHLVNEGIALVEEQVRNGATAVDLLSRASMPSRQPEVLFGQYEVIHEIKSGGMARAFKVKTPSHEEPLFLKMVRLRSDDEAALLREQSNYYKLERLGSPAVVRIVSWERDATHAALITEWANGGSLARHIKQVHGGRLRPSEAKVVALSVLEAIQALHSVGVIHRDIKPDNVVRSDSTWKLADLGIAKNLDRIMTNRTFQMFGTPGFAAPEQLEGADAAPPADVYSFGKLVVYMLTGQTDPDIVRQPKWRDIARGCCSEDPTTRPSVDDVQRRIQALPI